MFCIYGIDVKEAHARAEKRHQNEVSRYQKKLLTRSERSKKPLKKPISYEAHLNKVVTTMAAKKISPEYASPQNAQDFIALAQKSTAVVGRLKIMVWGKKRDTRGDIRFKRNGDPMMGYVEYKSHYVFPNKIFESEG